MLDYGNAQLTRAEQCGAHDLIGKDGLAVVGQSHGTGFAKRSKVGELLAFAPDGCSGDGKDVDLSVACGVLQPAGDFRRIVHGRGIGHDAYRGKTAGRGRPRTAGDGLLVRLAWLAQMDVDVNEPRSNDQPAGIEVFIGLTTQLARRG